MLVFTRDSETNSCSVSNLTDNEECNVSDDITNENCTDTEAEEATTEETSKLEEVENKKRRESPKVIYLNIYFIKKQC